MLESLSIIDRTDGVQGAETCRQCGGMCCQKMPGIAFPDDFGPRETLTAVLVEYFRTGYWAIDCWEGMDYEPNPLLRQTVYYVRPATVKAKAEGKLSDWSWGGTCSLWSAEKGCSLAFNNRPRQCRTLEPSRNYFEAYSGPDDKEAAAIAWSSFQDELHAAWDIVRNEREQA